MTYIIFLVACILILFIYWKLKWFLASLWIILFCLSVIGLVIIPINLSVGFTMIGICVGLMVVLFFIGLISLIVSTIVIAPILGIYYTIRGMFNK